jgi:glycosyltransferase involved in cell wall biosynthesis
MSAETRFSVVIPAYEPDERLLLAIKSVEDAGGDLRAEVIVVDDGSQRPASRNLLGSLGDDVRVRRLDTNQGPSAARNAGARAATGSWLVFLDADERFAPAALARFADAIDDKSAGVLLARVRYRQRTGQIVESDAFLPGSWAVRSDLFNSVGGYDEVLRYGENTDLLERIVRELRGQGGSPAHLDAVTVLVEAVASSRDYNRHRMESALHLLDRDARLLTQDPGRRSEIERIAAVNASRVGEYRVAIRCAARALRTDPRRASNYVRAAMVLTGPVARRYWLWRQRREYSDSSRSTATLDA